MSNIGIELETILDTEPANGIGDYSGSGATVEEIGTVCGAMWGAKSDSSIRVRNGEYGCEFVTPTLDFNSEWIQDIFRTVSEMRDGVLQARTNGTCGCHISLSTPRLNSQQFYNLIYLWREYQQAFIASTASENRSRGSYCQPYTVLPSINPECSGDSPFVGNGHSILERCRNLNISHMNMDMRCIPAGERIEFRVFSGTVNPRKVIAWAQLAHCFMWWAVSADPRPLVATRLINGEGTGLRTLNNLLNNLGWTNRNRRRWTPAYLTTDIQSCRKSVAILRDCAERYDIKCQRRNGGEVM